MRLLAGISRTGSTRNPCAEAAASTASRSRRPQSGFRLRRSASKAALPCPVKSAALVEGAVYQQKPTSDEPRRSAFNEAQRRRPRGDVGEVRDEDRIHRRTGPWRPSGVDRHRWQDSIGEVRAERTPSLNGSEAIRRRFARRPCHLRQGARHPQGMLPRARGDFKHLALLDRKQVGQRLSDRFPVAHSRRGVPEVRIRCRGCCGIGQWILGLEVGHDGVLSVVKISGFHHLGRGS